MILLNTLMIQKLNLISVTTKLYSKSKDKRNAIKLLKNIGKKSLVFFDECHAVAEVNQTIDNLKKKNKIL